jgi:hypothetical protein
MVSKRKGLGSGGKDRFRGSPPGQEKQMRIKKNEREERLHTEGKEEV